MLPKVSNADIHNFSSIMQPVKSSYIDPMGFVTTYDYNERGLLTQKTQFLNGFKQNLVISQY